jgi:hypothetical protein
MAEERKPRQILVARPIGKRGRGRPRKTWEDVIEEVGIRCPDRPYRKLFTDGIESSPVFVLCAGNTTPIIYTWKVLKCGVGEGWRRSVGPIM